MVMTRASGTAVRIIRLESEVAAGTLDFLDSVSTASAGGVLRRGTQPRASALGVSGQTPNEMYFGTGDRVRVRAGHEGHPAAGRSGGSRRGAST